MARVLLSLLLVVFLVACSSPPAEEAPPVASPSPGEVAAPAEPLAATIDAYLAEKGSPLAGLGAEFVASGRRHDVDPRLIVAIAGAETSFGTRLGCYDSSGNVVANPYNAWNWFYKGGCPSPFGSWGDGIDRVTAGLRRLYLDQGLTSIEAIAEKYTATEREVWVENVRRFYQELGGDPGDLGFKEEGTLVLAPGAKPAPEGGASFLPETPTPTATSIPTPTWTPALTNTPTWMPTPPDTPSPTATPTDIPSPTATSTATFTSSPTATPVCRLPLDLELSGAWGRDRLGCPTSYSGITWAAWEPFERGYMLWRSDTMEVYVLYFQNGTEQNTGNWQLVHDDWDGSNPNGIGLSPPAGLHEPIRGFGWVWRTYLGGSSSSIGWALQEERGICIKVQSFERGFIFRSSQAQCSQEYNRASELPLLLFALQGGEQGEWWRYGQ